MKTCLYSPVKDLEIFKRVGFYRDDIEAIELRSKNYISTNSIKQVLKFKPELVIGYFFSKSVFSALAGRIIGARVILTGGADQISPVLSSGYRLFIQRMFAFFCLLLAHRILLSCTDDISNFKKLCFGFKSLKNKLELVNHVVTPSPMHRCKDIKCGNKFSAFTLCWMGSERNARRKGVDRSIKLIYLLRKIGIDASLDIAGTDGPGKFFVEKLIIDMNLEDHVKFLGPISEDEKNKRLAEGHVYLQLSEHEGFGVAAAEAFFSGMIVVHSNKGGLRDVIGENGLIVNLSIIDESNINEIQIFYSDFKKFVVNKDFIEKNSSKYSIQMRSDAFFGVK